VLQESGLEVAELLGGSSLFLVGMMGTGKSAVGAALPPSVVPAIPRPSGSPSWRVTSRCD